MARKNRLSRWGSIAGVFAVIASLLVSPVSFAAGPDESITLSPYSKRYSLDASQTINDTMTVFNDGSTAYDFTVYATPYWVNNPAYQPNFTTDHARADAYEWVSFPQTRYHIMSRQTLTIPFTIHVPAHASPGGHYGTIFTEMQPNESDSGTSLMRKRRVGCILYVTVKGDVQLAGQTTGLSIPWFQSSPPMVAIAHLKNTGNSDYIATTKYTISDIFGHTKGEMSNEYEVLPGTTRDVTLSWPNASWFGLYHVHVSSTVLGKTTTASGYVLMLPLWALLLVVLIVLVGGGYGLRRQLRKNTKK